MRLVTFVRQNEMHIGAMVSKNDRAYICDFSRAEPRLPDDMLRFLQAGDATMASAESVLAAANERDLLPLEETTLLAPVPHPGKIICVGHNYPDHAGETPPAFPDIFGKFGNVVIGPNQLIIMTRASSQVDYEGELAVVIGKRARYVDEAHALDVVAGYTIFNDVTARDYQKRSSQWTLGKTFDTFGPMGPALVTPDEIGDPVNLELALWVNGEKRQHANTRDLLFSVPFLISYLSQAMTLEPGDVISTGTPSGTGASHKPPVFLKPGDTVRIQIERIGELTNPVVEEGSQKEDKVAYFEKILNAQGANRLPSNPCKLLDFNYLILSDGKEYAGASGDREILAVILGGKGTFAVGDKKFENVGGRANVFSGKPHSVYIPCQSKFSITAHGALEIGLCSAPSDLKTAPYVIAPDKVATGVWGAANFSRNYHQILTLASQPELPAARLIVGETFTPSGNWSTFPPHRHEKDDLPREAFHEEMYFFKVSPADGFGIARYYNDEIDTGYIVRDNTILMAPKGFHTVVSAPGYTTYYLWFLAGNQRVQATIDDPALAWVGRTVPMLKALGH